MGNTQRRTTHHQNGKGILTVMPKALNLLGQTFGSLYIESRHSSNKRGVIWNCRCTCGKIVQANTGSLVHRLKTKQPLTCGCIKTNKRSSNSYVNYIYNYYKQNAKKRSLAFCLTKDQLFYLVTQNCYWCGALPTLPDKTKQYTLSLGLPIPTNGIDRYDNSFGYESTNSVPCCSLCNKVKGHLSGDEFLHLIKTYYHRHFK